MSLKASLLISVVILFGILVLIFSGPISHDGTPAVAPPISQTVPEQNSVPEAPVDPLLDALRKATADLDQYKQDQSAMWTKFLVGQSEFHDSRAAALNKLTTEILPLRDKLQSALPTLSREMLTAVTPNADYDNEEEARIITGVERELANALGESVRYNHEADLAPATSVLDHSPH